MWLCYLAALAGADAVVVARGLVLAHEAGLVGAGRRRRGGGAGEQVVRAGAGALAFNGCRTHGEDDTAKHSLHGSHTMWLMDLHDFKIHLHGLLLM